MSVLDELRDLGVDVDGGLKRINGNEKLYTRLLGSFVKELKQDRIQPDFSADDSVSAAEKAHAIKGTSGNLSITPVFDAYSEIVNLLRAGEIEQARTAIEKVLPVQDKIVQCIEKHME